MGKYPWCGVRNKTKHKTEAAQQMKHGPPGPASQAYLPVSQPCMPSPACQACLPALLPSHAPSHACPGTLPSSSCFTHALHGSVHGIAVSSSSQNMQPSVPWLFSAALSHGSTDFLHSWNCPAANIPPRVHSQFVFDPLLFLFQTAL